MAKLDVECCPICCAPVKAIETCNSVRFEYDGPRWISVEDDLPAAVITPCLVSFDGDIYMAEWSHDKYNIDWWFYVGGEYEPLVTHWMPLPEPPKEAP